MVRKKLTTEKIILLCIFAIYSLVMIYLLFLQRSSYRQYMSFDEYLKNYTNMVPLKTIGLYISDSIRYRVFRGTIINVGGNVVLFIPLGILLPCIWKTQRHLIFFLLTVILLICSVEALQLLTMLGSCDIDDLILNVTGATIGFILSCIKPIKSLLCQFRF